MEVVDLMEKNRKEALIDELLSWSGITVQPHRFGGTEFLFEGKEVGHLHGNHLVDMLLPKPIRDEMVAAGRVQPHRMFPESGWVSIFLEIQHGYHIAVELLRLKHEHLIQKRNEFLV